MSQCLYLGELAGSPTSQPPYLYHYYRFLIAKGAMLFFILESVPLCIRGTLLFADICFLWWENKGITGHTQQQVYKIHFGHLFTLSGHAVANLFTYRKDFRLWDPSRAVSKSCASCLNFFLFPKALIFETYLSESGIYMFFLFLDRRI